MRARFRCYNPYRNAHGNHRDMCSSEGELKSDKNAQGFPQNRLLRALREASRLHRAEIGNAANMCRTIKEAITC
jgi:hypothetical protein